MEDLLQVNAGRRFDSPVRAERDNSQVRYEVELDGNKQIVELDETAGKIRATVGGRSYELEVLRPEPRAYQFFLGDQVFEARVGSMEPGHYDVKMQGQLFPVKLVDRKHVRSGAEHTDSGQQILTAPMPGKVVKILHEAGEEVTAGQGVVVVEAMKMQNEVKSTRAGRVIEVKVKEGNTVTAGQVLAIVE